MNRIDQIRTLLENDPKDSFLNFALAKEYEKSEQWDEVIQLYKGIVHNEPDYVGVYYHLAAAYHKLDLLDEAMKTYEDGIQVSKKLTDFHAMSELANAKKNLEMEML